MPCVHIDGVWFCGPGVRHDWVCGIDGCAHESEFLCDYPIGKGKTCDIPLCKDHSVKVGSNFHLCPVHAAMFHREAQGREVNPFPGKPRIIK